MALPAFLTLVFACPILSADWPVVVMWWEEQGQCGQHRWDMAPAISGSTSVPWGLKRRFTFLTSSNRTTVVVSCLFCAMSRTLLYPLRWESWIKSPMMRTWQRGTSGHPQQGKFKEEKIHNAEQQKSSNQTKQNNSVSVRYNRIYW